MFHLRASYADETEAIVNHLVGLGINQIAVFYQNDGFGKSGLDGVIATLAQHKLKPVAVGSVERNSLDVGNAVTQIAKADVPLRTFPVGGAVGGGARPPGGR